MKLEKIKFNEFIKNWNKDKKIKINSIGELIKKQDDIYYSSKKQIFFVRVVDFNDWYDTYYIIHLPYKKALELSKDKNSWSSYKADLEKILNKYIKYETINDYVPSMPNTSKFYATISGELEIREEVFINVSYVNKYMPISFIIGNNIKDEVKTQIENEVIFTSFLYKLSNKLTIDYKHVYIGRLYGTRHIQIGLCR